MDKTCPIIVNEISELLRNDNGYVGNLFREDSIDTWAKTLDATTNCHAPTKRASGNLRDTVLPGERCAKCRSLRQTWLDVLLPLRADVRYYYAMFNGATDGLTTCLLWGDKSFWFEAALLFEKPEMILGIPIDVAHDKDELAECLLSTYHAPESYYLELPYIFAGCSFDLVNFCMGRDRGCPPYFIFVRKAIIAIQEKGWWAYLHHFSNPVVRDDVDAKAHLDEKKRSKKKRPHPESDGGGNLDDNAVGPTKKNTQKKGGRITNLGANLEQIRRNHNRRGNAKWAFADRDIWYYVGILFIGCFLWVYRFVQYSVFRISSVMRIAGSISSRESPLIWHRYPSMLRRRAISRTTLKTSDYSSPLIKNNSKLKLRIPTTRRL